MKVRSYGKGRAKKKRKNVPSLSKQYKKDSFVSVSVSKPSARITAAKATGSTSAGYRKPVFPISLADRNGLKNLPRQIFSACGKFGGNPCRDVDILGFRQNMHFATYEIRTGYLWIDIHLTTR